MKYRDRTTGQVYSLYDLQLKFSSVSFPENWDESTYDFANVDPVITVLPPEPAIYNRVDYTGPQFINGQWTDTWSEVPKYDDPVQQQAWIDECLETQWENVRGQRNFLLAQTDYTDLPNTPISAQSKQNFLTYRQALRDVTTQSDPYNITWPTVPEYVPSSP
jgi:hypothetical protein